VANLESLESQGANPAFCQLPECHATHGAHANDRDLCIERRRRCHAAIPGTCGTASSHTSQKVNLPRVGNRCEPSQATSASIRIDPLTTRLVVGTAAPSLSAQRFLVCVQVHTHGTQADRDRANLPFHGSVSIASKSACHSIADRRSHVLLRRTSPVLASTTTIPTR
jgi:hypothetical protein